MSNENKGIIYRILNTINGKSYIGKTKEIYGSSTEFGLEKRWKNHIAGAKSSRNECPRFYNAIRKYGSDKFVPEIMLYCNLDKVDYFETLMISTYDTTNSNFGYNIANGGGGRSVVDVPEDTREKISKSQRNEDDVMNIRKVFKNEILVGYRIWRKDKGKSYSKLFTNTKFTPEENFKQATDYLNSLKNHEEIIIPQYNKTANLPKNITYHVDKRYRSEPYGYKVSIYNNGKSYNKTFCSLEMTMEEKFKLALEYKEELLKQFT
jgi:group I intron endonuclease